MKQTGWRYWGVLSVGVVLASCSGSGGSPQSPAAPAPVTQGADRGIVMESSRGLAPEGFKLAMKVDPKPGLDGIIREGSPVTVEVDLCGSTPDAGKTLHFLYDWDFNDLAEVVGTGDACVQKHTYRVPKDATKDLVLESNVCVTNGDPGVHDGSTYFSCRVVRVALPKPASCSSGLAEGCQAFSSVIEGGIALSVEWPGGSGPYGLVLGYEDSSCGGTPLNGTDVAVACSLAEAQALCENEDAELYGTFPGGQGLYFCFGLGDARAAVPTHWGR